MQATGSRLGTIVQSLATIVIACGLALYCELRRLRNICQLVLQLLSGFMYDELFLCFR